MLLNYWNLPMKNALFFAWLYSLLSSSWLAASTLAPQSVDDIKNAKNPTEITKIIVSSYWRLTGIPKEIGNFINLKSLVIEDKAIKDLPSEMAALTKLEILKMNGLKKIPNIIYKIKSLIELDLSFGAISEIDAEIGDLKNLKALNISFNHIAYIPDAIGELTNITVLNVINNNIYNIPKNIGKLKNLENLLLGNSVTGREDLNIITELPDELFDLTNLKVLYLGFVALDAISAKIAKLKNLEVLELSGNSIAIPEAIYSLKKLKRLSLNRCELRDVSPKIGDLCELEYLNLDNNSLVYLPKEIEKLRDSIILLSLRSNPIAARGVSASTLGHEELVRVFGDKVLLSRETKEIVKISKDEVYGTLQKEKLRLNLNELKKLMLPELMNKTLSAKAMLKLWRLIIASLNFTKADGPGYLSYDLLAQNPTTTAGDNADLIEKKLLPKLSGYLKTLWEIQLDEGELGGWQMYEDQRADLKKALSYILINIYSEKNAGMKAALFSQLVNGLTHCPGGQKEGVDSLILTLQQGEENKVSWTIDERIKRDLAFLKNELFKRAVLPGYNTQNVHILSLYFYKLKDELGLTSALPKYIDKLGAFNDPFQGSEGNALQEFFQYFNPVTLEKWLEERMERQEDLRLIEKTGNEIKILQNKLYFAEAKKEGFLKRNILLNKKKIQEKVIVSFGGSESNILKRRAESMMKELEPLNLDIAKYGDDDNIENEILKLKEQISNNKAVIKELKERYSMTDFIDYLLKKELISLNKTTYEFSGWEKYFAEDPGKFFTDGEKFPKA